MFEGRYSLWGGEHSLFTRKLQAMLNYLDVDYEFCLKTEHARADVEGCLLYTSPSPRDKRQSRMPSSA